MEMTKKALKIRGEAVEVWVPGADASGPEMLGSMVEAIILSLVALNNPEVDQVLTAYGVDVAKPSRIFSGETDS